MRMFTLAMVLVLATGIAAYGDMYFSASGTSTGGQALAASANFHVEGANTLVVTVTNTSAADVLAPGDVLTAVFFDTDPTLTLTRLSAVLGSGSTVLFPPAGGSGPVVGGEWAYKGGLLGSGAPGNSALGISSSGLGLFGPGDLFPGDNLQGPASPDGIQYGITSAGDNSSTGNAKVTGSQALIQNQVVFTFTFLPNVPFTVNNVSFQYGTSLGETNIIPAPGAALLGLIGLGIVGWVKRRFA